MTNCCTPHKVSSELIFSFYIYTKVITRFINRRLRREPCEALTSAWAILVTTIDVRGFIAGNDFIRILTVANTHSNRKLGVIGKRNEALSIKCQVRFTVFQCSGFKRSWC